MRLCSRKPQLAGVATFVRLGFNALGADPFSPFTPGDCRPSAASGSLSRKLTAP
jgi:hypothetical protein